MKVSVVVPAYNAEKYLEQCLVSITRQTVQPYELIVVDDGSTDKTRSLAEEYASQVALISDNLGIGYARHYGANLAKGDCIAFLSADDAYHPYYLEYMTKKATGDCVFSNYWRCDERLKVQSVCLAPEYRTPQQLRKLACEWALRQDMFVNFSTVMIPKRVFDTVQFDENLRYGEDLVFLLNTILKGYFWCNVQLPLVYYRVHPNAGTFKGWNLHYRRELWGRLQPLLLKLGVDRENIQHANRQAHHSSLRHLRRNQIPKPIVTAYRKLRQTLF